MIVLIRLYGVDLYQRKTFEMLKKSNHCLVFYIIYIYIYKLTFFLTGVYFCSKWCSWHQVLIEGDIDCMIYSFHWHKTDGKSCGSKRMNLRWNISTSSGYCNFQISFPLKFKIILSNDENTLLKVIIK